MTVQISAAQSAQFSRLQAVRLLDSRLAVGALAHGPKTPQGALASSAFE